MGREAKNNQPKLSEIERKIIDSLKIIEAGFRLKSIESIAKNQFFFQTVSPLNAGPNVQKLMPPSQKSIFTPKSGYFYFCDITSSARKALIELVEAIGKSSASNGTISEEGIYRLVFNSLCILKKSKQTKAFTYNTFASSLWNDIKSLNQDWLIVVPVLGAKFVDIEELKVGDGIFICPSRLESHLKKLTPDFQSTDNEMLNGFQSSETASAYYISTARGDVEGASQQVYTSADVAINFLHFLQIEGNLNHRQILGTNGLIPTSQTGSYFAINPNDQRIRHSSRITNFVQSFFFNQNFKSSPYINSALSLLNQTFSNCFMAIKMVTAVKLLGRAYISFDVTDRLLFTVIALETVIVPDSQSGEISEKFSLRIAVLLSAQKQSRIQLRKFSKKIYTMRSRIAHTGSQITRNQDVDAALRMAFTIMVKLLELDVHKMDKAEYQQFWEDRIFSR